MPINYPSSGSPLTCAQYIENLDALLDRSNHTGTQSASTIYDLDAAIAALQQIIELEQEIDNLMAQYNALYQDLYGNGQLATLIADLQAQIDALLANDLTNALLATQIFTDLQTLATTNQSDLQIITTDLQTLIADYQTISNTVTNNSNSITQNIADIQQNAQDIQQLIADLAAIPDYSALPGQVATNAADIAQLMTDMNNVLNNLIPALQNFVNLYPTPSILAADEEEILVNTDQGLVFRPNRFVEGKSVRVPIDYPTIQEAIDSFDDKVIKNCEIVVFPGTHSGNLLISDVTATESPLLIRGSGETTTFIQGFVEVLRPEVNLEFVNLTIQSPTAGSNLGVRANERSTIKLTSVTVEDFNRGAFINGGSTLIADGCTFKDCANSGIFLINGAHAFLNNGTIDNCNRAIDLERNSAVEVDGFTVSNCNRGTSILTKSSAKLENSTFTNNYIGVLNEGSVYVDGCNFEDNTEFGILTRNSGYMHCVNSTASNNGAEGFNTSSGASATLESCSALNNDNAGIFAGNSSTIVCVGCTSQNNGLQGYRSQVLSVIYAENSSASTTGNTGGAYYPPGPSETIGPHSEYIFYS